MDDSVSTEKAHGQDEPTGSIPATSQGKRLHRRYDRLGRILGDTGLERLASAHVAVIGCGGVGSFAVESLARSGIGKLTLVDFDRVCVTNANRQLQALSTNVAKRKVEVLAERVRAIDPRIEVRACPVFYAANTSAQILSGDLDYVIDSIDNLTAKSHLLAECKERQIRVITTLGSAGRLDPLQVGVRDLGKTEHDGMALALRRILRTEYAFPSGKHFGIPAVWSREVARDPVPLAYDGDDGFRCVCPGGTNPHHSCDDRSMIRGTVSFVTGVFGLVAAGHVVREIAEGVVPVALGRNS
jgi:tRNA threonylcarbamoyladenosine dehydratase